LPSGSADLINEGVGNILSAAQRIDDARTGLERANELLTTAQKNGENFADIAALELDTDKAREELRLAGDEVAASLFEGAKRAREQLSETRISIAESSNSNLGRQVLSPDLIRRDNELLDVEFKAASRRLEEFLGSQNFSGFQITGGDAQSQAAAKAEAIRFANDQIRLRLDAQILSQQSAALQQAAANTDALVANTTAVTALANKDQNVYISVAPGLDAQQIPSGIRN